VATKVSALLKDAKQEAEALPSSEGKSREENAGVRSLFDENLGTTL